MGVKPGADDLCSRLAVPASFCIIFVEKRLMFSFGDIWNLLVSIEELSW